MNRSREYVEDGEEDRYIARNRQYFLTPFEARAEHLGILREKARAWLNKLPRLAREKMAKFDAEADDGIRQAIGETLESFDAFQRMVADRIAAEFKSGHLVVLRCPACHRVAFTPETRQCIWCGHDWHSA